MAGSKKEQRLAQQQREQLAADQRKSEKEQQQLEQMRLDDFWVKVKVCESKYLTGNHDINSLATILKSLKTDYAQLIGSLKFLGKLDGQKSIEISLDQLRTKLLLQKPTETVNEILAERSQEERVIALHSLQNFIKALKADKSKDYRRFIVWAERQKQTPGVVEAAIEGLETIMAELAAKIENSDPKVPAETYQESKDIFQELLSIRNNIDSDIASGEEIATHDVSTQLSQLTVRIANIEKRPALFENKAQREGMMKLINEEFAEINTLLKNVPAQQNKENQSGSVKASGAMTQGATPPKLASHRASARSEPAQIPAKNSAFGSEKPPLNKPSGVVIGSKRSAPKKTSSTNNQGEGTLIGSLKQQSRQKPVPLTPLKGAGNKPNA